jgi:putative ABC transport system permease protein
VRGIIQDLGGAGRMLERHRGSTFLIIGLLALGIGACTAVFSLFDAVLLRPLPVRDPQELVRMVQYIPRLGVRDYFPYRYYQALCDHAKTLASAFGGTGQDEFVMTDPGPAEEVDLDAVTSRYFKTLGVRALYGRTLSPSDAKEEPGTPPAVLSYRFWKRRFGGNPRVVNGRIVVINKHHFAIVGVMPRDFHGVTVDTTPDL